MGSSSFFLLQTVGRTGRSGNTGIATTFVNMNTAPETLLDLKYLLKEAKQRYVSPFLPTSALRSKLGYAETNMSSCLSLQHSTVPGDYRRSKRGPRQSHGMPELWWFGTHDIQLSKARRYAEKTDGYSQSVLDGRWWLLLGVLSSSLQSCCCAVYQSAM